MPLLLKYALNNKCLVHIDTVPNGLSCGCVCPQCHQTLIAKNDGHLRQHHFAHASGAECAGARMTALHLLAQKVLAERKTVMLPAYNLNHGPHSKTFDSIILEKVCISEDSTRRPDCIGSNQGKNETLWIEIYCTNKIDESRKRSIIKQGQYCIEIDFSDLLKIDYSKNDVIKRLEEDTTHREWICCPHWDHEVEMQRKERKDKQAEQWQKEQEEKQRRQAENEKINALVNTWKKQKDAESAKKVIEEIKRKPFAKTDGDICIFNVLVPSHNWKEFTYSHPRNSAGKDVFYTLMHYYPRVYITDFGEVITLNQTLQKLLQSKDHTPEIFILMEYIIVLLVLKYLEDFRRSEDENSKLGNLFINNKSLRESFLQIIFEHGWSIQLSQKEIHNKVLRTLQQDKDAALIKILQICFPICEEPEPTNDEPWGFAKELRGKTTKELFAEINQEWNK